MSRSRQQCVCGLYYNLPDGYRLEKNYLPPIDLKAHATILATTSRTVLTQTFLNTSKEKGIKECRYAFPLYEGVSVVGFTCRIGERTIIGEVKEKVKAKAVFEEAVAKGETAGLLEQIPDASDVFTITVGNVPPGAKIIIEITYLGELKHDMEVDGIRFTIPNIICPRYGDYPGPLRNTYTTDKMGGSISIIVDAEMPDGSLIQRLQSPTHPISMTMGTTSFAPDAEPTMTKASASLTLKKTHLETDFVLQIIAKDTSVPKAVLECHPTTPNQRALMATLVPKFSLPSEKPEIVFVCDRSGSMDGSRIKLTIQALKVFLKSLPVGVRFNICSFGTSHSFLWPRSVSYSQQTLDEAISHVEMFQADYGGTQMLQPLRASIEQRYQDMPLEVMVLTDGQIWNQEELFEYLNQSVGESKSPIRVFTLGIGNGVSHSLIEGVARAGKGFSQTVGEGEKMDTKVVRMLKGALSPHVNDCTLEVKYKTSVSMSGVDEDGDDFEIIELVDCLKVDHDLEEVKDEKKMEPMSLFDKSADPDKEIPPTRDNTGEQRYAHLPKVDVPKIIQAPQHMPPLFAFNRKTIYLIFGPDAPQATPTSVVLRGHSAHGPLELEIPIHFIDKPGETIHQLAAKKAISELEQGRGWLAEAKDDSNTLLKTKYDGHFEDMVEREAVRLGITFQVGGKWCSFVAVESSKPDTEEQTEEAHDWEFLDDEVDDTIEADLPPDLLESSGAFCAGHNRTSRRSKAAMARSAPRQKMNDRRMKLGLKRGMGITAMPAMGHLQSNATPASLSASRSRGAASSAKNHNSGNDFDEGKILGFDPSLDTGSDFAKEICTTDAFLSATLSKKTQGCSEPQDDATAALVSASSLSPEDLVHYLIGLQSFVGTWDYMPSLIETLVLSLALDKALLSREVDAAVDKRLFTTALVVVVLEERLVEWKGSWELVVEKARGWLSTEAKKGDVEEAEAKARVLLQSR